MLDARDAGGGDGHDRRGDVGVAPARHVGPRGVDRDVAVAGDQAGDDLDLGVQHRRLLRLGEAAHVVMREADIVAEALGHLLGGGGNLVGGDDDLALPFVELCGVVPGLGVATGLDLVEDALHRGAHIGFAGGGGLLRLLEISDRHQLRILSWVGS